MDNLKIKGHIIGEGIPLICVPVMKKEKDKIVEESRRLVEAGVEMIEWRVDAFARADDERALQEVLLKLEPVVRKVIFLVTIRTKEQGGMVHYEKDRICRLRQAIAEAKVADLIDLEYYAAQKPRKEIAELQKLGAYVIASHHDFDKTPPSDEMRIMLEEMGGSGADLVKLAVMPRQEKDVLSLLAETLYFHQVYRRKPLITMSMGGLGSISRVCGETFGSCVTFASAGKCSAPGQLPLDQLRQIMDMFHASREQSGGDVAG